MSALRWALPEHKHKYFTVGGRHFYVIPARREQARGYLCMEETELGWMSTGVFDSKRQAYDYHYSSMFGSGAWRDRFSDACHFSK